jgi:hypothetical protein
MKKKHSIEISCYTAMEFGMPNKRSKPPTKRYDVGYRRPPKQFQFKKGQIGNPEGINRKASASIVPDLRAILECALNAKVTLRRGERDKIVSKAAAGIEQLVDQFANGERNARRDLILLCEKVGVDLTNRKALEGVLEDALSAEDEALLADFVRRHGGQYPVRGDAVPSLPAKDQDLLSPPADDPKLLTARRENLAGPANEPIKGDVR